MGLRPAATKVLGLLASCKTFVRAFPSPRLRGEAGRGACVIALLLTLSLAASASPVSDVSGPSIDAGHHSVELRTGYAEDDLPGTDYFASRLHYEYDFTDAYALRLVAAQRRREGDDLEHDAIGIENRFQFFRKERDGFDGALYAIYGHKDGDKLPRYVEARLVGVMPAGNWDLRTNIGFSRDVGPESGGGVGFETGWQGTYAYAGKHRAGLEMFNDFGRFGEFGAFRNQGHELGPVFKGPVPFLPEGIDYQAGYRAGLSDAAPDHTVKLFLAHGF